MLARGRPACHIQNMDKAKRPRDTNQLAKFIVDVATGDLPDEAPDEFKGKNPAAVMLGRRGGKKGGKARAEKLSPEERRRIAQKAALTRWAAKADTDGR